ncbi:IgaA/UmoB family intracellular growth attenuator [Variovorax sp. J22G73]|uniref:IgaA/UmoB family intracellular growth attenuator n=1 Tax=unclassified Variovorax TaxID=663243 RepID=UPI002577FA40|nr:MULTISPECIES: IgaA/UmoB family intracellular growth attenuator [unclassified Variovorax]MDM0008744.1 IgaA/UmoB family intracellular growth attenuator [Variovorax sp. J22R203]MDM0101420.1 IgaA/UmoB family intracellular growth attenuator [Variovorax sp. J22G73]
MDTVIILLKVGLILYAIYSFIVYATRRSGNKSALKDFRARPVLRRITDEEKSALQPFLMGQGITIEDEVRELGGAFLRHGLQTQGSSTEHDTIGEVDVLLPYDALSYVEAHNEALVVLSKKCAVVIRVNGFDLLEGRLRAQRQQAQDAQWKRGEVGALPGLDDVAPQAASLSASHAATLAPDAAAPVPADPEARYRGGEVYILNQRAETPEEVASRVGRGSGWVSALLWLLAFALLWLATWSATRGAQPYLLGAGLLAGLWAAWLFVRRPSMSAAERHPQQVNRVRGMLNEIAAVNVDNVSIKRVGLFIGDKLSLQLPPHWAHARSTPYGVVIEAELRADDCSAVSFGDKWSVADEWRRFRPVYWGRHLLHLLVGLLALAALALSLLDGRNDPVGDLRADLALVAQTVFHDEGPAYTSAEQLAGQPPKWGSLVSVKGEGRCEIDMNGHSDDNHTVPVVDCTRMRWNGQAPVVPELKVPQSIVALGDPDLVRASENGIAASLIAMLRMQMGQAADPLAAYRARESVPMVVRGFDRTVALVDAACKDSEGLPPAACRHLQQAIVDAVEATVAKDGADTPVRTWPVLAASAAPDKENADLVLTRSQLARLRDAVRQAVDARIAAKVEATRPAIVAATGGVVLVSTSAIGVAPRRAGDEDTAVATDVDAASAEADAAAEADSNDEGAGDRSLPGRWARLQRNAAPEGVKPFALAGLVTLRDTDDTGAVRLHIDPNRDATQAASAAAHTLWWVFALALVLANGVLFALRLSQSLRRRNRLHADIASRPAPGATGLF